MKFTISREKLQETLRLVAGVSPKTSSLPVLSNVCLETTDRGVRITATDLDVAMAIECVADVDAQGSVTVPARKLQELAGALPPAPVKFSATNGRVEVLCGRSRTKLLTLPFVEWPSNLFHVLPPIATIKGADLKTLVRLSEFATSDEESRPILNGVLCELRPGYVRFVATNGHRLAKAEIPGQFDNSVDAIIPPAALTQILKAVADDDDIAISADASNLQFETVSVRLCVRLIEGPYPRYDDVIPKDCDRSAVIDRLMFMASVKRAMIVASDQTHRVRLDFKNGDCLVSSQTPDLGESADAFPVRFEGEAISVGVNGTYAMDFLSRYACDELRLSMKAPERAILIEPIGESPVRYMGLLMPLRLVD